MSDPPTSPDLLPFRPAHGREAEADIVRGVKAGEEKALGRLMGLYWHDLIAFARTVLEDRDRAEDVVQDAFVRLWAGRREWRRGDTLRPLLYRMVRNGALNERRRQRNALRWRRTHPGSERDPAPTPHERMEEDELSDLVRRAIEDLPSRRREIFVLVRYHQLSYREAGEVLGLSPRTVANQVSQASKDLRKALAPHLSDRAPPPPLSIRPPRD